MSSNEADGSIVIEMLYIHIERRHREVGPGIGWRVVSGGEDIPIGRTRLMTTAEHGEHIQQLAESIEDAVDLDTYDPDDIVAEVVYESLEDGDPAINWSDEEPEAWDQ